LLLGDGGFQRRQRARLTRLEYRLRGVIARGGIARQERQTAERGIDRAAQPIVDPHRIDVGGRVTGDWLAGRGIEQFAGIVLDVDRFRFGAVHQSAVLQRANNGLGARVAAGGDVLDAGHGLAEIVGGEMGKRIVEPRGMHRPAA